MVLWTVLPGLSGQISGDFLTFKDVKFNTWEETYASIRDIIAKEARRHKEMGQATSAMCTAGSSMRTWRRARSVKWSFLPRCLTCLRCFISTMELRRLSSSTSTTPSIQQTIFSGNAQKLQALLEDFMLHSISSMDGANEGFYRGMMLGLCVVPGNRYQVRSNRESGLGRFDI